MGESRISYSHARQAQELVDQAQNPRPVTKWWSKQHNRVKVCIRVAFLKVQPGQFILHGLAIPLHRPIGS